MNTTTTPLASLLLAALGAWQPGAAPQAQDPKPQDKPGPVSVRREGPNNLPRPLRAQIVSGNYFATFGIQPYAGRLISESDDRVRVYTDPRPPYGRIGLTLRRNRS